MRAKRIRGLATISRDGLATILDIARSGFLADWYGGPVTRRFEAAFSARLGTPDSVAVNSGTSALHAAYVALGLSRNDEVILPCSAYISAATAAIQEGAVPVACDIDPMTYGVDTESLANCITNRTRLIVVVHLYGIPTDMRPVMALAQRHNIAVVEDSAQALGASYCDRQVGTSGVFACFSFSSRKHIYTGQGGVVTGTVPSLLADVRKVVNKGKGVPWTDYQRLGFSYAMPELTAAVASDALTQLDDEIRRRQRAYTVYEAVLAGSELKLLPQREGAVRVHCKVPVILPSGYAHARDFVVEALNAENIAASQAFPPVHRIPWIAKRLAPTSGQLRENEVTESGARRCPVGEDLLPRTVDLECGPCFTESDAEVSARGLLKVWKYVQTHGYLT